MEVSFKINGKHYTASSKNIPIDTSLNTYLRSHAQLQGTKFMCLEGGCGACMVTVKRIHPITQKQQIFSVNSCLKSLYSCDGLEIITIEGIGNKKDGYHPIQRRLHQMCGSQCGYCSPGMVVTMYSLLEGSENQPKMHEIERSLGGNICRCTGYRPILDAFKSFASDADQKLIDACKDTDLEDMDIEDLTKSCPKTGKSCTGLWHKPIERPLHFEFPEDRHWYKAVNVKGIFDVLDNVGSKPYMLVGGNTAQGIVRVSSDIQVFIDISTIPELHKTELVNNKLAIGGSVSLKETKDLLEKISKQPGFEYCTKLVKHIEMIASNSVRNLGSIAGNLCFKNQHNDFPSDLFIIFTAADARITIMETNNQCSQLTMEEFMVYKMNKTVLYNVILPRKSKQTIFETYKIMVRAQNAHAYVNAGFSFDIADDFITNARICFGGIHPKFVRAALTEKILVGKILYCNDTLKAALSTLAAELKPDWILPEGSPQYRKNLALSLFYKFVLGTAPANKITAINRSGGSIIERPISSGTQSYATVQKNYPLTQPVLKYDGLIQCSGEAKYANDLPPMLNELWAAFVIATKVHAKIGKINTTEALNIPGVEYFFSAKDIIGKNNFTPASISSTVHEEVFVGVNSEVLFHGQPVGIILAKTMNLAILAASKVKIIYEICLQNFKVEQEPPSMFSMARSLLTPLLGAEEQPNRKIIPTIKEVYEYNAKERFHDSRNSLVASTYGINTKQTINGRFQIEGQFHYTMEAQTTVCVPAEDGIDLHTSTQWVDFTQTAVAELLAIPENHVNITVRRLGGAFGAKISRASQIACACALACFLTNRPIRFVMAIDGNMKSIGKRLGLISNYSVEIDDIGKIQKITNNFSSDMGCSLNEQLDWLATASFKNCYISDTFSAKFSAVLTDSASNTFCRAPGTLEGISMIENMMEHIAAVTERDAVDVRLANMAKDHPLRAISSDFLRDIEYRKRQIEIDAFNKENRWRKRGIAVVFMQWPCTYFFAFPAYVAIYHRDGSVVISHGGIECGQGINTKVAQAAAYVLGVPFETISVKPMNNVISANAMFSGSSVASEMAAFSVKKACEELVARMKPVKDAMPAGAKFSDVTEACFYKDIDLRATYLFKSTDEPVYNVYGLTCAEMEVDILTGNYQLKRVDLIEDVGDSMSPYVDVGQVEGAFVMGMGYWLSEKLVYSRESGELLSDRTWNYKPPGANDIPVDFRITFLRNSPNPNAGVLRSKAVGEPATCMAIVVIFALRNALSSARKDAGLPNAWISLGSGVTPETAFLNCGSGITSFSL